MQAHHHYTQEEKQYLSQLSPDLTYAEVTAEFNRHFGLSLTESSVKELMCKRLKLKRTPKGQFKTGPKERYSIGSEIVKAGYIWVKVNDEYFPGERTSSADYRKNWKRKSDVVWEKTHGAIPKGMFIIFLDQNPMNCDITNLYPVDRKVHAVMTNNRWYSENPVQTLTAIKWAEMYYAIKARKDRGL